MKATERTTTTEKYRYDFFRVKTSLILIKTSTSDEESAEYNLEIVDDTDGYMCGGSTKVDLCKESFHNLKKVLDIVQPMK